MWWPDMLLQQKRLTTSRSKALDETRFTRKTITQNFADAPRIAQTGDVSGRMRRRRPSHRLAREEEVGKPEPVRMQRWRGGGRHRYTSRRQTREEVGQARLKGR